jgi:hypothetical protein
VLRALARLGYVYPPDTLDWDEHQRTVARAAGSVADAWPALTTAFGGSPEVGAMIQSVLR